MGLNLGSILMTAGRDSADRPAVRLNERVLTYRQLDRAARGVATALRDRGLQPGDRVALLVPNVPEFTIAYYGALYAGCAVVPINVLASGPEVDYFLRDSEARLLVAHPLFEKPARAGAEKAGVPLVWSSGDVPRQESFEAMQREAPLDALHDTGADDTAVIIYTSGTTGKPKGAELTHSNLFVNCALVIPRMLDLGRDDVALATLPLFHSFGMTCIQNACIALEASFTLLPRFGPKEALEIMQRDGVTLFAGVPTMYFAILNYEEADRYDLSKLRFCLTGGSAMPVEVLKAFEAKYGVPVLEGYGLSETSPVASFNLPDRERVAGTIGWPVWGVEMAILDDQDRELDDDETGEIAIRGHNIMKGYWKRPDATKETLKNGWFHSGDIGLRDETGRYRIVDRKKDMILRGGFNVYPREVEEVLYAHPDIVEAAVVGVAHESHGEEVKAIVAVRPGKTLTDEDVIEYCKANLAAYKYPRIVEFRDELPKGPTGKILKRELR